MACDQEVTTKRYQHLISTLTVDDTVGLYQYQGFWYPMVLLEGILSLQENFKPERPDIVVCSSPKTGFTWLKALCFAIATRTSFDELTTPLLSNLPHHVVPTLEIDLDQEKPRDPQLPLLSTHLPFISLPESIKSSSCKIIYMCRDPKDTVVSLWHFTQRIGVRATFESCFQRFCEGKCGWGPYWDHVLGYWKASIEMPEKILFLKYEDLKNDTVVHVRRIADFMGKPFSIEEDADDMAEKIAKFCSFENMSSLEVNKCKKHRLIGPFEIFNSAFFRKGTVGDWKNVLTAEMIEKIDEITEKKMSGSGFKFGASY